MYPNLETVRVGGLPTVRADRIELSEWIGNVCQSRPALPALVFSSNGQGIALYGQNPDYDAAMDDADVIHADGMPVVMASKWLTKTPIRGRSATTDLFHDVAEVAQNRGLKFFVLGATEKQNESATKQMKALYPGLEIVGRRNGYFSEAETATICAEIVSSGADILWVGLGKPKQEIWSHQNREALAGISVIKTCGGLYAFLSGDAPRAPKWMQKAGLEWLYRLSGNPKRLFKRYLVTNLQAMYRLGRFTN
jgi:exopolysaccharide biosynthesis WecB/TagA/CpsF family protein